MSKISVIIVNWNGKKWLRKCLSSLVNQTYKTEIIVVDNASSDDSVRFIKGKYKKVRVIENKKNLGYTKAINIGIKSAKGEFVIIFNNDTWVEKNFIEELLKFYKTNEYDVIGPREKYYDKSPISDAYSPIDFLGNPAYGFIVKTKKIFALSGVCLFCKKKFYEETRGLDEDFFIYFDDIDWFWRLQLLGKKFATAENVFIYHFGSGSSPQGLNYKTFLLRNKNNLQMLLKNYSLTSLLLVLPVYIIQNLFEILFFLLLLKPKLAYSYLEGWNYNIRSIRDTLNKRKWIQKNRVIGDKSILKNMYPFPLRLIGAIKYLK